jgi:hypothetical protein
MRQQQQQQQQQAAEEPAAAANKAADRAAAGDAAKRPPLAVAVLYKSRGVDRQVLAADAAPRHAPQQQQRPQPQQQKVQAEAEGEARAAPPGPRGQPAGPSFTLDRAGIIDRAVAVMQEACADAGVACAVNLSAPDVVLMVEVLPLMPPAQACAIAALPASMMSTSHKLKVKLTSAGEQAQAQHQGRGSSHGGAKRGRRRGGGRRGG